MGQNFIHLKIIHYPRMILLQMRWSLICTILLIFYTQNIKAAKILVLATVSSHSHAIFTNAITSALAARGHEVSMILKKRKGRGNGEKFISFKKKIEFQLDLPIFRHVDVGTCDVWVSQNGPVRCRSDFYVMLRYVYTQVLIQKKP